MTDFMEIRDHCEQLRASLAAQAVKNPLAIQEM